MACLKWRGRKSSGSTVGQEGWGGCEVQQEGGSERRLLLLLLYELHHLLVIMRPPCDESTAARLPPHVPNSVHPCRCCHVC